MFVREGYLAEKSNEDPDMPLHVEFTKTYLDGLSTLEHVGRGWWVSHNPVEDELVPESAFTDSRPTYLLGTT